MFQLNRNKQKTHQNSLKESIFGFETPKQTEFFSFCFHDTNRNKCETDLNSVYFGSNHYTIMSTIENYNI
jgi:hypothetical protein